MSWFGWLTKGHYEVSALDRFIGFTEFIVLLNVCLIVYAAYYTLFGKFKKRRRKP